jgi:uncharacterized membrane protein YeaQ/YmgE (transglycosylase-associated protein family)
VLPIAVSSRLRDQCGISLARQRALPSSSKLIHERTSTHREIAMIGFIVAGLVIGALARLLKPGKQNLGWIGTLLLGLAGSVIGGTIASLLGTGDIFELNVLGFIVAVIAAFLLIGVAEAVVGRKKRDEVS